MRSFSVVEFVTPPTAKKNFKCFFGSKIVAETVCNWTAISSLYQLQTSTHWIYGYIFFGNLVILSLGSGWNSVVQAWGRTRAHRCRGRLWDKSRRTGLETACSRTGPGCQIWSWDGTATHNLVSFATSWSRHLYYFRFQPASLSLPFFTHSHVVFTVAFELLN